MAERPLLAETSTANAPVETGLRALAESMAQAGPVELAVVVPTYNERENIGELMRRLESVLAGIRYEVLVVDDDSPDGTAETARDLAQARPWMRVIRRIGRNGLASACLEGMLATGAPAIAVMDADLQHDETILPRLLARLRNENLDVVVGTRNSGDGAGMGEFAPWRVKLSNLGLKISRLITRTEISDPMSGFFLVKREFLNEVVHRTSGVGFKILVDLVASSKRPVRVGEVPYTFRNREHGASKLDVNVGLEYLYLVLDKLVGDRVPVRFGIYAMVGAAGIVLHLVTLGGLLRAGVGFEPAQMAAAGLAMTGNFLLNNLVTHRDARLRGWRIVPGLITFYLACAVGFITNLSVSKEMLAHGFPWLPAGIAGLAVGSVWNYGVTSVFTWSRTRRR